MVTPTGKTIAKNTSFLTTAYVMQKLFAFIYFTLIARWIGPEDIGKYVFAISLTTIFSIFIDLGLSPILIRETAKFKERANTYLNTIVSAKLIFSVITYGAVIAIISSLGKDTTTTTMVYLSGLVMILDSFTLSFWGVFRGYQNLRYESISIIINQIIIVAIGLGGLWFKLPLTILIAALLGGSLFSFLFSLTLIHTKLGLKIRLGMDKEILKMLLRIALPFALAGIFTRVYSYIDQVLLSILVGDQQLGWYSVAYKITFALQFVPMAFAASIFPAMSHYFQHDRGRLKNIFEKSMYFLMIVSIPVTVGIMVVADKLILTLYSQSYQASIIPLQILIIAVVAIFLSFPVGSMLNSCNKQHINTANLGVTMLINIILNLILIPKFQHIGASIAATISLYYLFLSNLYFVKSIISYDGQYLLNKFFISLTAAAVMGVAVWLLLAYVHIGLAVLAGVIIYPIALFILRGVTADEIRFITDSMFKRS